MDTAKTDVNGRTSGGRFAPGNRVAKGNPNTLRMGELRRTLLDAVDASKLREAFLKLQDMAVAGDLAALQMYLNYSVGRPSQAVELSGPDGEALGSEMISLVMASLARHPSARIEVAAALRLARDSDSTYERIPFPSFTVEGAED